jgi:hypothetical protein
MVPVLYLRGGTNLKVEVGVGLGSNPTCIECGGHIDPAGLVVGLYGEYPSETRGALRMLGEFCSECAERFTKKATRARTDVFDPGMTVDLQGARAAVLRASKRLRRLALNLEQVEIVRDMRD